MRIRTTLYFGLSRPKGSVSELDWQIFLRDEVTRRFPDGLTVWQAEGQPAIGSLGKRTRLHSSVEKSRQPTTDN